MKQTLRNIFFFFIPIAWDRNAKRVIKAMEKVRPLTQEEKNAIRSLVRVWKKEGIWSKVDYFYNMADPEFYHINWFDPENTSKKVTTIFGARGNSGLYRAMGQSENRPS